MAPKVSKTAGEKSGSKSTAKKSSAKTEAPVAEAKNTVKKVAKKAAATSSTAKTSAAKKTPAKKAASAKTPAKKSTPAAAKTAAKKSAAKPRTSTSKAKKGEPVDANAELETSAALMEAYRQDTDADAEDGSPKAKSDSRADELAEDQADSEQVHEYPSGPRPEAHPERLQKILSQAGIASRRHAEEMIVEGRVMVNGQVVTQLGAKADLALDHIRVDGKMIQGAERHRTFLLNKPKGYVTTVSDPEGRPTVADLFSKFSERLYPVGRLDFLSEGLLIMTNDGELANLLTRASSGVEKTYVVKVAGQLTPDELERLRKGVAIEKGEPGSQKVRTAPAAVRQIRPGDNPWYEVILIEGRNREIRKMFSATGHFVEKIRRVAYGPLVLDVEPGKFRELTLDELSTLRLTAEGKMKARRPKTSLLLPKEAGIPEEERASFRKNRKNTFPRSNSRDARPGREARPSFPRTERPSAPAGGPSGGFEKRPFVRPERPFGQRTEGRAAPGGTFEKRPFVRPDRPFGQRTEGRDAPGGRFEKRPFTPNREASGMGRSERPAFRPRTEGAERGGEGVQPGRTFDRPREDARGPRPSFGGRPDRFGKSENRRPPFGARPGGRPGFDSPRPRVEREPRTDRPAFPAREPREALHIEEQPPRSEFSPREGASERSNRFDRPRPSGPRPGGSRPSGPRSSGPRPSGPRFDRPGFDRPQGRGPAEGRAGSAPRFGGPSKPRWVPRPGASDRPSGPSRFGGSARPSGPGRPSGEGRPSGGSGRPASGGRPSFGARPAGRGGKPAFGSKPGGFRKPGFGGKPGGGPPRRDRG